MSKQEFLARLRKGLAGLPQDDIEERVIFYGEIIEDRMEEGLSEEEAVSAIGPVEEIVAQVIAEIPLVKVAKERIKPKRRLQAWEIILLALGAPLWFSLGIAAISVVFSLYLSVWAVIISLWSVFGAMIGCSFACIVTGIVFMCGVHTLTGVALLAAGLVCAGLSIFIFYGDKVATKGILITTKAVAVRIKNCFIKKEEM